MSAYSLNGAESPFPIGDIPVSPGFDDDDQTPRAQITIGNEEEFRRAPRLRLQGRSLSARDPSFDFDSPTRISPLKPKGRLLPTTPPEDTLMFEKNSRSQHQHGFWQLSPSEERIRRTRRQLSVNDEYDYGGRRGSRGLEGGWKLRDWVLRTKQSGSLEGVHI
ncbi:hypothetical protein L596_024772 [Steinernema carpocapsae]|uniref:Uncharacterized protein n=1 Tax=Steinernema carpocapsae TaxID=34508 RepID=A0A4U5M5S3_STECR|nr:hypothetical protein L596_024772 [Steinernema carpocapsae]